MTSTLILAQSLVAHTVSWNFSVAIVMIFANLVAIAIGRFAIQKAGVGPDLPGKKSQLWQKFGVAELLATMSFGHILGAGMILGLANAGAL